MTELLRWFIEFYSVTTVLLLVTCVANVLLRQPAHRLLVTWVATIGVVLLAIATLFPIWPRAQLNLVSFATISDVRFLSCFAYTISLVILAIGLWLLIGWRCAAQLVRRSRAASSEITTLLRRVAGESKNLPDVRVSNQLNQPIVTGLLTPRILVPQSLLGASDDELETVLTHELTHIRRGDLWLLALCRLLLLLLFANPCYWWLRRQIRLNQELLADAAASTCMSRILYAELLVRWSIRNTHLVNVSDGMASLIGKSQLQQRIAILLDPNRQIEKTSSRFSSTFIVAALSLFVICLSLVTVCSTSTNTTSIASTRPDVKNETVGRLSDAVRPPSNHRRMALERRPKGQADVSAHSQIDDPMVVHLTCDISLEVVGVRQHPCLGDRMWKPNGFTGSSNKVEPNLGFGLAPEMLLRIYNPNNTPLDWKLNSSEVRVLDDKPERDGQLIAVSLPTTDSAVDFSLGVSVGGWETRGRFRNESPSPANCFTVNPCNDSDDMMVVAVKHALEDADMQIVAVDLAGCEHRPTKVLPSHGELIASFAHLPPQCVDEFYIQTRRQRWVEFRDVSVVPGQLTKVQVQTRNASAT